MNNSVTEATATIYGVLEHFDSEQRKRIVKAALTLLGDQAEGSTPQPKPASAGSSQQDVAEDNDDLSVIHDGARTWVRKVGLSMSQLEHYFHFDQGKVKPIELPGNAHSKQEQRINAYLAQGLAAYLASGDPSFMDEQARKLCEHFGCYDATNHAKTFKAFKNRLTGSKSAGWKLTTPGLTAAAELVK